MYNDSVLYRQEYSYYNNISNLYNSNRYNTRDGIPQRNLSLISQPNRYGYLDPYLAQGNQPTRQIFQARQLISMVLRNWLTTFTDFVKYLLDIQQAVELFGSCCAAQTRNKNFQRAYNNILEQVAAPECTVTFRSQKCVN